MDFADSDIEDDVLDFERSSSPEADNDADPILVCENGTTSPNLTIPSIESSTDVGNEKYKTDYPGRMSATPTSQTAACPSKLGHPSSPKVTINLQSVFIADNTEIRPDLTSITQARKPNWSISNGPCDANALPLPSVQVYSPKVSFDAWSSFSCDQSSTKKDSDSDTAAADSDSSPVLSKRALKVSFKAASPLSKEYLKRNVDSTNCSESDSLNVSFSANPSESATTNGSKSDSSKVSFKASSSLSKKCLNRNAATNRGESDTASDKATVSHRSPKVRFNPSSLIFTSNPQITSDCSEDQTPHVPTPTVTNISFDPSSLLETQSISSSDDEIQLATTDNTSKNLDLDQQAESSNTLNNGPQVLGNGGHERPIGGLRGILKLKKSLSPNEKIVTDCLKLLCKTANEDRHHIRDLIRASATEVFKNLCFDQFFRKGECFSSTCDDNHLYKSHIFLHSNEELWNASLYVICHAAAPNLQIVENLFQHYNSKGNAVRSLLFAKCIAKVKDSQRLELAHFMVNQLSGTIPTRDIITVVLMLNFPELSSLRYNVLMEGLGVFEQNTTHYSELMVFLNFRGYRMPARLLVKLMEDSIKCSSDGDMVESISGFLKRLHPSQKDEIQPTAKDFEERFRVFPASDNVHQNQGSEGDEPPQKKSNALKKKVNFAADPQIREFEVEDCPWEVQCEVDTPEGNFSDEDCEDNTQPDNIPNFYGSSEPRDDAIDQVFRKSCRTWILNGQCSNTVCNLTHDFSKSSLAGLSSEDVYVAADSVIAQSENPSIEILNIFIEFLAESNETARVLKFRKCALKMSSSNSSRLTKMVISVLGKQIGRWEAIEKVLVPNIVELDDPDDGQFLLDKELLKFIMSEACKTKTSVLRCVTRAIMHHITLLPYEDNAELIPISTLFIQKFVMAGRELLPIPDILPVKAIESNSFASHFKVALYQGVTSKYFLATIMMKQAVNSTLRNQAVDVLYTFLLSNFDRARVLTHLFENCKYFDARTKKAVIELFGTVGLKTSIRLYESENFAGTAELFYVLKRFKLNIFTLLASHEYMTEFNLATIYCSVTVDTVDKSDTIDIFFSRCVDPLKSVSATCLPDLMKLTAKMFRAFTSGLLVEESLKLYKGITFRQKSLISPLNIVEFVEPTLRCTFNRPCDSEIRKESLKLYLDVVDSETPIHFQKVTHRSAFLIAVVEIIHASQKFEVKGHINVVHPLIKKMLLTCINEGVYFDIRTPEIMIYSSMTIKEIEVYVLWWFFLYVRARKRKGYDYFSPITVKIVQDCIQDDSRLPLHPSLRSVSVSITDCTERVTSFIKNAIAEPIDVITSRERGVFELHPATVRAMSQTAINIMLQHGYIAGEVDRMCTFCYDKLDIKLADKL